MGLAGPVGSGKTTLLLALLGELGVYPSHTIDIGTGPIAYASQVPSSTHPPTHPPTQGS